MNGRGMFLWRRRLGKERQKGGVWKLLIRSLESRVIVRAGVGVGHARALSAAFQPHGESKVFEASRYNR